MLHEVTTWVVDLIAKLGYAGIFGGMGLQATGFVPLPSEVMMSFGGYLAQGQKLELWAVIAAGTLGDIAGALVAYAIGYYGGRPLLERFGKLVFVRPSDLERIERWSNKFGSRAVLICRLLPGIRAFASLPAGVTRMHVAVFAGFTAAGSLIWCTAFASLGFVLGKNWAELDPFIRRFSVLLVILVIIAIGIWIWSHFRAEKQAAKA
ncbi:MAG TPA: DedA family protein [Candidatus Eremiobacteraceae bacterium]|nr:DedA family protein [Candidatus Eremiobacteraceae bacterium]